MLASYCSYLIVLMLQYKYVALATLQAEKHYSYACIVMSQIPIAV